VYSVHVAGLPRTSEIVSQPGSLGLFIGLVVTETGELVP